MAKEERERWEMRDEREIFLKKIERYSNCVNIHSYCSNFGYLDNFGLIDVEDL